MHRRLRETMGWKWASTHSPSMISRKLKKAGPTLLWVSVPLSKGSLLISTYPQRDQHQVKPLFPVGIRRALYYITGNKATQQECPGQMLNLKTAQKLSG